MTPISAPADARAATARAAAAALRSFANERKAHPVTIGFDGFVDSIIEVVEKRHSPSTYDAVPTIERYGQKILAAAGKSANYELVIKQQKLGGNGPIMANAMAMLGLPVTYLGAIGYPAIHPVFEEFAKRATCIPIADVAQTDCLEFTDGKLMLGKHQNIQNVGWDSIKNTIGADKLVELFTTSSMVGMVNWSMLTSLGQMWQHLIDEVLPRVAPGKRSLFIDLTDPEKRPRSDLQNALRQCSAFQKFSPTTLGCNLKEAHQVAEALDLPEQHCDEKHIEPLAAAIRAKLDITAVVVHPRGAAAASIADGSTATTGVFAGPFVKEPKISTGAGDHFNAGFCLGQLAHLPVEGCLCVGTATSGYYVRHAASPTLEQLADFCDNLPAPQAP